MAKKKQLLIEDLWATLSDGIHSMNVSDIVDLKFYIQEKLGVVENGEKS